MNQDKYYIVISKYNFMCTAWEAGFIILYEAYLHLSGEEFVLTITNIKINITLTKCENDIVELA